MCELKIGFEDFDSELTKTLLNGYMIYYKLINDQVESCTFNIDSQKILNGADLIINCFKLMTDYTESVDKKFVTATSARIEKIFLIFFIEIIYYYEKRAAMLTLLASIIKLSTQCYSKTAVINCLINKISAFPLSVKYK